MSLPPVLAAAWLSCSRSPRQRAVAMPKRGPVGPGPTVWPVDDYADEAGRAQQWLGRGVLKYHRRLATVIGAILDAGLAVTGLEEPWPGDEAVAEQLSPSVGLPASVLAVSLKRESYGILPISDDVIASQQRIADTFFGLGLLPKA